MSQRRHPGFQAFRYHVLPLFSERIILGLRKALDTHDPRLIQGSVCKPSGYHGHDQQAEQGCIIGYAGMLAGCETVGEVNAYFKLIIEELKEKPGALKAWTMFACLWDGYTREYVAQYLIEIIDEYLETLEEAKGETCPITW